MPELEELEPSATAEVEQVETAVESETTPTETEEEKEGGVQRRIDKLTKEKKVAERKEREARTQNRELTERLDRIEKLLEAKPAAEQAKADATDPKPDPATWTGTNEEYTEALSRWAARQEHKSLSEKDKKAADAAEEQERYREVVNQFQERTSDYAAEHDDYNEVVGTIKLEEKVGHAVQIAIMEDENGPALAYYLGQHPELCKEMSELSPARAVAKLGRITERLFPETSEDDETDVDETEESEETDEIKSSPAPKPKPAVPAPIKPIKKTSSTATGLRDDLSPEEWAKRFRKQMKY